MTSLNYAIAFLLGVSAFAGAAAPVEAAPDQMILYGAEFHSKPGEFTLYDRLDKKVVNLPIKEKVQVCMKTQYDPLVPPEDRQEAKRLGVKIESNGATQTLSPGQCVTVNAQNIVLRSKGDIPQDWALSGQIKKRG